MDRRVDVRHFVHRRSCDISSSNMAAYERWPRVSARGTKYSSEVCRMGAWCVGVVLITFDVRQPYETFLIGPQVGGAGGGGGGV